MLLVAPRDLFGALVNITIAVFRMGDEPPGLSRSALEYEGPGRSAHLTTHSHDVRPPTLSGRHLSRVVQ